VIPLMLRIAPIIKHPAFKEEKEWRLISLTPCTSDRFHYRPSQSFIIPYYRLNLLNENLELPLEKIIIGPTSDPELAKKSVESFLVKETRNMNGKIVSVSKPENFLGHTNIPTEVSK